MSNANSVTLPAPELNLSAANGKWQREYQAFLRLKPPRRAFAGLDPLHVLCGHGQGGHGEGVPEAVRQALATPRRRLPQALLNGLREARRHPD